MKKKIFIIIFILIFLISGLVVTYKLDLLNRDKNVVEYSIEDLNLKFKLKKEWEENNLKDDYGDRNVIFIDYNKQGYSIHIIIYKGIKKIPEVQIVEWYRDFYNLIRKIDVGGYEVYVPDIVEDYNYEEYENIRIEPYVIDEESRKIYPLVIGSTLYSFELAPPRETKEIDREIAKEYYDFLESIEFDK